jgi:hypothetical protein
MHNSNNTCIHTDDNNWLCLKIKVRFAFADKEHLQAVIPILNDFPVVSIPNNERYVFVSIVFEGTFNKYKTFSVLIYSYINMSGNWENEKMCGNTTPEGRSVFTQFRVFPISTSVDIIVYQYGKMLYMFYSWLPGKCCRKCGYTRPDRYLIKYLEFCYTSSDKRLPPII